MPAATPVTMPDALTVAMPDALVLHTPPLTASVKVVVVPAHIVAVPFTVPAFGAEVTVTLVVAVALHPFDPVTVTLYVPAIELHIPVRVGFCEADVKPEGPCQENVEELPLPPPEHPPPEHPPPPLPPEHPPLPVLPPVVPVKISVEPWQTDPDDDAPAVGAALTVTVWVTVQPLVA